MRQSFRSLHACLGRYATAYPRDNGAIGPHEAVERFLADSRNSPNDTYRDTRHGGASYFAEAVRTGLLTPQQFQVMLERGADPLSLDYFGNLAVLSLANEGAHQVVLMDAGYDLHTSGADGRTLLHAAAESQYFYHRILLPHADPALDWKDRSGMTPLACALQHQLHRGGLPDLDRLTRLIDKFGVDAKAVEQALLTADLTILRYLVQQGADLNAGVMPLAA